VIPLRGAAREIVPWSGEGDHAGGDALMLAEIFLPAPAPDKYRRASDERGGVAACAVGIAANICFETGRAVRISELVPGLRAPEFAAMPSRQAALTMPTGGAPIAARLGSK
jgi:hypothetical protein